MPSVGTCRSGRYPFAFSYTGVITFTIAIYVVLIGELYLGSEHIIDTPVRILDWALKRISSAGSNDITRGPAIEGSSTAYQCLSGSIPH